MIITKIRGEGCEVLTTRADPPPLITDVCTFNAESDLRNKKERMKCMYDTGIAISIIDNKIIRKFDIPLLYNTTIDCSSCELLDTATSGNTI
tara:strand:+ start:486 stop:761 length:276 start_codon:yes stop_codon:yes gene_type:complete